MRSHSTKAAVPPVPVKRRVNLTLREDLVDEARRSGMNLSQFAEEALELRLRAERAKAWREENKAAIAAYNAYIEKYGSFSAPHRKF